MSHMHVDVSEPADRHCDKIIVEKLLSLTRISQTKCYPIQSVRPSRRALLQMSSHGLGIAIRHLLKSPGFTATAALMLALGIGATTAIFSIMEGVLLRPLPFPHPERLVALSDILQGVAGNGEVGVTAPDILAYTRDTHSFENLGGFRQVSYELSGIGEPVQVNRRIWSTADFVGRPTPERTIVTYGPLIWGIRGKTSRDFLPNIRQYAFHALVMEKAAGLQCPTRDRPTSTCHLGTDGRLLGSWVLHAAQEMDFESLQIRTASLCS